MGQDFFFFGIFAPDLRASLSAMATACLRLVTFFLERPLRNVPALRFFIARSTSAEAFFEYFRAMMDLPMRRNNGCDLGKFPTTAAPTSVILRCERSEPRRMAARTAVCHPSRLAEDGEHLQQ